MFYPNVSTQTLNFDTALIKEIIQLIDTHFTCAGMQDYIQAWGLIYICLSSVPALTVVPLQFCPGFGIGHPHCTLQAEKQQRPHVAVGR